MKLPQLSIVVENKAGGMIAPCKLLADAGINIVTLSLADPEQNGVLRLIVAEWQRARMLLKAAGYKVLVSHVLAIEVADKPGGLMDLLRLFADAGERGPHVRLHRAARPVRGAGVQLRRPGRRDRLPDPRRHQSGDARFPYDQPGEESRRRNGRAILDYPTD